MSAAHLSGMKSLLSRRKSMIPTQVPGAEVTVYRIQDPIRGDDQALFDDGVLDAAPVTQQVPICTNTEWKP